MNEPVSAERFLTLVKATLKQENSLAPLRALRVTIAAAAPTQTPAARFALSLATTQHTTHCVCMFASFILNRIAWNKRLPRNRANKSRAGSSSSSSSRTSISDSCTGGREKEEEAKQKQAELLAKANFKRC